MKPSNICLNNNLEPFIIDFGMAKKIITNNKHIEERTIHNIIGSPKYISLNVINLKEPTRRDDMESIMYILMYMILDDNQYINYTNNKLEIQKSITKINEILLNQIVDIKILAGILYIRKLNFSQQPNYDYIKEVIN